MRQLLIFWAVLGPFGGQDYLLYFCMSRDVMASV